jgi:hypothetical protein
LQVGVADAEITGGLGAIATLFRQADGVAFERFGVGVSLDHLFRRFLFSERSVPARRKPLTLCHSIRQKINASLGGAGGHPFQNRRNLPDTHIRTGSRLEC